MLFTPPRTAGCTGACGVCSRKHIVDAKTFFWFYFFKKSFVSGFPFLPIKQIFIIYLFWHRNIIIIIIAIYFVYSFWKWNGNIKACIMRVYIAIIQNFSGVEKKK